MTAFVFKNSEKHIQRARELRKDCTRTEQLLWDALTGLRKELGLKFRRQHPLHPYIVDFACIQARLIVELDGSSHDLRQVYDEKREAILRGRGWTVIRFDNDDVLANIDGIVMEIIEKANELIEAE